MIIATAMSIFNVQWNDLNSTPSLFVTSLWNNLFVCLLGWCQSGQGWKVERVGRWSKVHGCLCLPPRQWQPQCHVAWSFGGNFRLWGGLPNDAIISFDLPNGDKEAQQKLLQDVPKLTWTPLVSIFMDFFLGQLPSGWSLGRRTWALGCSGCYCERRASRPGICKEVCSNSWPFRQQEICLPWPDWSARWTNMPMPPRAGLECSKTAACQLHAVKVMLTFCEFARCFPSCVYAFPHNHFAGRPVQYTHLHAAFMALQLDF